MSLRPFALSCLVLLACNNEGGADADGEGEGESSVTADSGDLPIPEVPRTCEGFDAMDVSAPTVSIAGDECNEDRIRAAVEAGGTVVLDCPGPVMFTAEMNVAADTVIDGSGTTVLDGGGATRLIFKRSGATLWLQNITLQNAQAPNANGNPALDPNVWADWPGGAVLAQCHDTGVSVGGEVHAKNFTCKDSATGEHTRSPADGSILDTGSGGCIYSFQCTFHCDGCTFSGNRATNGGAIGTIGGKTQLTNSSCVDNEARYDTSTNDNQGYGGCYYQDGTETAPGEDALNYVHYCGNVFSGNVAETAGGAVSMFYRQHHHTSFEFNKNLCQGNGAGGGPLLGQGGCLYSYVDVGTTIPWAPDEGPDTYVVSGNTFLENAAINYGGGAAIYNVWETATRFDNNVFVGNRVETTSQDTGGGGALGLSGAYFAIEHSTFANNVANNWAGGITTGLGGVELRNNIFFHNTAPTAPGNLAISDDQHVGGLFDETDDQMWNGFLVYGSSGNLFTPSTTPEGQPSPSPGGILLDVDPLLGELVSDDTFPPYLPLGAGSPAIDAGIPLEGITVDIRGHERDGTPDLGAYEVD